MKRNNGKRKLDPVEVPEAAQQQTTEQKPTPVSAQNQNAPTSESQGKTQTETPQK